MKWVLVIIVPILVYVGLGWIVSDIYFSMSDTSNLTIHEYNMTQAWIRSIIASVYIYIVLQIEEGWNIDFNDEITPWIFIAVPLVAAFAMNFIPVSAGSAWLLLLICILDMMWCTAILAAD